MDDVSEFWTDTLKKHWKALLIVVITVICFLIGLIMVFFGYMQASWIGGFGTWTFDDFSIGNLLLFMIQVILWDLLLVVLPFGIFAAIFVYLWWNRLPEDEKSAFKREEERQKSHKARNYGGGGGGLSFFIGIVFLILVYNDGTWLVPFGSLPYTYFIYVYFYACLWIIFLFVIPACILGLIWYIKKIK